MVRVREARRAFREFHTQCFWYLRPDLQVSLDDIPEIVRGLRRNGGRKGSDPAPDCFRSLVRHQGCVRGAWPTVSPYRHP